MPSSPDPKRHRPHAAPALHLWLTPLPAQARPSAQHQPLTRLEDLWARLQQGPCSELLVDRRFRDQDADAWEVALRIRERYPRLPMAIWAPPPGQPLRPRPRKD
jgi:hypothetical protein